METWMQLVISILALLGGSGWVKYYIELKNKKKNENELLVTEYLAQIETRLKSNRDIKNRIYEKYREDIVQRKSNVLEEA